LSFVPAGGVSPARFTHQDVVTKSGWQYDWGSDLDRRAGRSGRFRRDRPAGDVVQSLGGCAEFRLITSCLVHPEVYGNARTVGVLVRVHRPRDPVHARETHGTSYCCM
jgi:hypothetical protein